MPKAHQYFTGSLAYARGDEANRIYVLRTGKISLVSIDIETGEEVREPVVPGEFFGVKSALGHFPREENAVAVADSTAMVFSVPEFDTFAISNPSIILKMLKVFSIQLRRVHAQIARLTTSETVKPDEGLFAIGEKYLKLKRYAHAKYIFSRYLVHYPQGARAAQAAKNLKAAEAAAASTPVKPKPAGPSVDYRNAISLISSQKHEEAIEAFTKIIDTCKEQEWVSKSEYAIGNCLFLQEKFEDCIKYFSDLISKNPGHAEAKEAMFSIGQAYERMGNKAQAASWYNKILALPDMEAGGTRARVKQALKGLGA
jgi:TolA-binding protein